MLLAAVLHISASRKEIPDGLFGMDVLLYTLVPKVITSLAQLWNIWMVLLLYKMMSKTLPSPYRKKSITLWAKSSKIIAGGKISLRMVRSRRSLDSILSLSCCTPAQSRHKSQETSSSSILPMVVWFFCSGPSWTDPKQRRLFWHTTDNWNRFLVPGQGNCR